MHTPHPCRWTSTFLSRRQLEYVGTAAKQQNHTAALTCRLCDWQELHTALPPGHRFGSIIAVDPVTMAGVRPNLLAAFFELLSARLAGGGRATVLTLYAAPALVAAERRSASFFKNELLPGAELPTREEVAMAATQAGLTLVPEAGAGGLSGNYAATMRQWRLQLAHAWHACINHGVADEKLRRCGVPPRARTHTRARVRMHLQQNCCLLIAR